uniref:Uncharacterized protein n=1 Tax=Gopherus agassizii TaxID=38772 RepID=A0A452IYR8_9SAUR
MAHLFLSSFYFCRIKSWVDKMQVDLVTLARSASGVEELAKIYTKYSDLYTVEANNARDLVEIAASNIEKLLSNRSKALVLHSVFILLLTGHFTPYFSHLQCK